MPNFISCELENVGVQPQKIAKNGNSVV